MNALKSIVSRSPRTKLIAESLRKCTFTNRQLSGTTKNATLAIISTSQSPNPFVTQGNYFLLFPAKIMTRRDTHTPPDFLQIKPLNPIVSAGSQRLDRQKTPFHHLMNSITHSLTTTPSPSLPHLFSLLRAYSSSPSHWSKYAHADATKAYTRNLVCEVPGLFNLLLLVWTPGKASPVHDHTDSHCLMKVLLGEIRETRYAMPNRPGEEGPMVQTSSVRYGMNKVSYMADEVSYCAVGRTLFEGLLMGIFSWAFIR